MRTISGLCVPYNVETFIRGPEGTYLEVMRPGVFARSLATEHVVPLMSWHSRTQFPLGVSARFDDTADGLFATFRLTERSHYAMTAWHHIVDGSLGGLSVGFRPIVTDWTFDERGRHVRAVRVEAALVEVSVCAVPAYETARITRHVDTGDATPHLDAALVWLDSIKSPPAVYA
jgi:HK97 family phage prohead protease